MPSIKTISSEFDAKIDRATTRYQLVKAALDNDSDMLTKATDDIDAAVAKMRADVLLKQEGYSTFAKAAARHEWGESIAEALAWANKALAAVKVERDRAEAHAIFQQRFGGRGPFAIH